MIPKQIVVASGNSHKIRELQTVAEEFGIRLVAPKEISAQKGLSPIAEVVEDGATYLDNAVLKADAFCAWCGEAALGDDSGLEVAVLGGAPGMHSARFAGPGASDREKIDKLLSEVRKVWEQTGKEDRRCRFISSLVLQFPDGKRLTANAELEGIILDELKGDQGFGYDPIIFLPSIGATLAEVDFEVTCKQGFRGIAARKLFKQLCP